MCTLTEKANAYIATLPTEERFAALRGFFAGAEEVLRMSRDDFMFTACDSLKECETFKAGDYRQAKPVAFEQRTIIEAGLIPLDAWNRL